MDEETLRKQRYRNLLYSVNSIYNEMTKLNTELNTLNNYLKENFIIDNEYICQSELTDITNTTKTITNELAYTVIPNIRYKSY